MRILNTTAAPTPLELHELDPTQTTGAETEQDRMSPTTQVDQVDLSTVGAELHANLSASGTREVKVSSLAAAVAGGLYRSDPEIVAAALVDEVLAENFRGDK